MIRARAGVTSPMQSREKPTLGAVVCAHPWLASAKRRENPRYLLGQPVAGSWNSWADKKVEIAVRARHQIDVDADYRGQLVIWLESLQLPTFDKSGEMQPQRKK